MPADSPVRALTATALSALILCGGFAAFSTIEFPSLASARPAMIILPTVLPPHGAVPAAAIATARGPSEPADMLLTEADFANPASDFFMDPDSELYTDAVGLRHDAAEEIGRGYMPA